jgi:hypothetical protein
MSDRNRYFIFSHPIHGDCIRLADFIKREQELLEANNRLLNRARAAEATLTMGAQVNTPDFLDWMAARLVHVYGESPLIDFVQSLQLRAAVMRQALGLSPCPPNLACPRRVRHKKRARDEGAFPVTIMDRIGKTRAGRMLDDVLHDDYPTDRRVKWLAP